jgi:hypothetical protein
VDFFNALRADLTPELERRVEQILENILSQHFMTQSTSNLSRSSSSISTISSYKNIHFSNLASCQLLRSNTQSEIGNSTMFQLPLFNLSQHPDILSHRYDTMNSGLQTLSNQSGTKGILKLTAPSTSNFLSTFDGDKESNCQFITLFPVIHLTQSDRTVLTNIEK